VGRPSRSRALGIWANGLRVGRWLLPVSGPMELAYDAAWVASEQGRPLSLSLPMNLDGQPLKGDKVGFDQVGRVLPRGFPAELFEAITSGLQKSATLLSRMPPA
jgi:serine/threonine-protein kinase HipA